MLNIVLSYWNMASYCSIDDFPFCLSCSLASVFHVVVPTVSMICSDVSPMSMICLMVNSIELGSASIGTERTQKL